MYINTIANGLASWGGQHPKEAEAIANARLIAEAPAMAELVDRLATLLRDACGRDNLMTDEDAEAITEARAAIAAAKGEAT